MTIMLSRYLLKGDREGSDEDGMDVASASTKIEAHHNCYIHIRRRSSRPYGDKVSGEELVTMR
jgi:hypothetical protein